MVLQRWQSVYLLIAAIALGLATFMPVFDIVRLDKSVLPVDLQSLESAAMPGGYAYFILLALSALLSLITIFKYKNLKLQKFALICTFLAKSRIIHDDRLIHAADRLR